MKHIFYKVDQLRATGKATLNVPVNSPYSMYNGQSFKVESIGYPGVKCRVSLEIYGKVIDFTLSDIL